MNYIASYESYKHIRIWSSDDFYEYKLIGVFDNNKHIFIKTDNIQKYNIKFIKEFSRHVKELNRNIEKVLLLEFL